MQLRQQKKAFQLVAISIFIFIVTAVGCKAEESHLHSGDISSVAITGIINPVAAEYIHKSLERASSAKAGALLIELDTPGGLDTSMRSIVKDIMSSRIPVIVYVAPSGARAASAGVFIALSAHIAAMAPGTNIGAAHPVSIGEKMDKVMAEKATNDAAAYIKSIAEERNRNSQWAEDAVRKSVSITEIDALKMHVIDLVAKDTEALLKEIDGRELMIAGASIKVKTASVRVIKEPMSLRLKILNLISDPSFAYILMLLGFYGLFFELTNPGTLVPGVIGVISLVLAFYAFQTIPVNYAGLLLIVIGIVLFLLEVKVASYGLLTVGGIVSITLGSLMLFESPLPFLRVSLAIILPVAMVTAVFFILTFRLAYKAHKREHATGRESLVGMEGLAKSDIGPSGGLAQVHGEIWSAFSEEGITKNSIIVVEDVRGLKLLVKKR
ncbi:MAG TPA: nodulation protein NfeD [Dissulfurispiraceae bacterium]|nr:nodulation protein NfeD [Dissulfurispiraceae bacterium]